ncbi:MAG: glycine--tRNA ligase [Candidatus Doudnabacteria bacterium RIFCSPHIGHO2_01_FULL_43_23]|uniref:Glycine--tRNA ligase n=1 Tax=Candidatus Doudnabacteria bacterium RIFCSPHIGHO2_01_FULL_43_23 TaxID=1817822 RepID=A0A1F5NTE1_9BACT|nr:MAG: glycine--tRNA ligase [Candidatus Doudnabacteria bacterium RIFCSPHIGHO2_01_FULL_43_23]
MNNDNLMEKIISLCKRRGFIFPGSEIYGGLANSYDFGPMGVLLKNNIKQLWWKKFVLDRDDMVGLDAGIIMSTRVWEASGHLKNFNDLLVECKKCHARYRQDDLEKKVCVSCGGKEFTQAQNFNTMFKTNLGPVETAENEVYLRPETAQAMFVDFKAVLDTSRKRLPFGIAQIGKAFRNEITPGNFIFRTREFEQMEIEYFIAEKYWKKHFEQWMEEMKNWIAAVGINENNVKFVDVPDNERAHYSKRTVDVEYKYPFGQKELYGLAYRTDYDLKAHASHSGKDMSYTDPETNEKFVPHVIEPSLGVERTLLAVLLEAYHEEGSDKDKRVVLKLKPALAPYKVAVFPLLKNKPELVKKAREIYDDLRQQFPTAWDDRGNVGKRYYAQDEIGTPYCITVDFDSLEDKKVTVRDRDTMKQERVEIESLPGYLKGNLS